MKKAGKLPATPLPKNMKNCPIFLDDVYYFTTPVSNSIHPEVFALNTSFNEVRGT
jgi:hypothetical protein